jgi:preprotein translocase subunit SecD
MLSITVTLPITEEEAATLRSILDGGPATVEAVQSNTTAPAAKAAAPKAAPKVAKPEPAAEEDLVGEAPAAPTGPTKQDAVDKAIAMVNSGGKDQVKAALEAVGVKRVSELKDTQVQAFLDSLEV